MMNGQNKVLLDEGILITRRRTGGQCCDWKVDVVIRICGSGGPDLMFRYVPVSRAGSETVAHHRVKIKDFS